jgi:hypothetical protein
MGLGLTVHCDGKEGGTCNAQLSARVRGFVFFEMRDGSVDHFSAKIKETSRELGSSGPRNLRRGDEQGVCKDIFNVLRTSENKESNEGGVHIW